MASSQTLQDLTTALQQQAGSNPQLVLNTTNITANSFNWLLQSMGVTSVTIQVSNPTQQITYTSSSQTLSVNGTCSLYGGSLPLTVTLTGADVDSAASAATGTFATFTLAQVVNSNLVSGNLITLSTLPGNTLKQVNLSATGSATQFPTAEFTLTSSADTGLPALQILPTLGLSLSAWGFTLDRTAQQNGNIAIAFSIDGTITFGNIQVNVALGLPTGPFDSPNIWTLQFTSDTGATGLSITNLVKAFGGTNIFQLLPSGLTGLASFALKTLKIVFDASSVAVSSIYCDIGTADWTVATGFVVKKAGFKLNVTNPLTKTSSTIISIYGNFQIGTDASPAKALLDVYMTLPLGSGDWLAEISGEINTNGLNDVYQSLPGSTGTNLPAMPTGLNIEQIKLEFLNISFNPATKSLPNVSFSVTSKLSFPVVPQWLTVSNPYAAFDIDNPLNSSSRKLTGKVGGYITFSDWLTLQVEANKPEATSGWIFSGKMLPGEVIPIMTLVRTLLAELNITNLPDWVNAAQLDISDVEVSVTTPSEGAADQTNKYNAKGKVDWQVNINTFALPKLTATVDIQYQNKVTSGNIAVDAILLGMNFRVGYKFGANSNEVYLEWEGIVCSYITTPEKDTIKVVFGEKSLGDIITTLMNSFDPGFSLSAPWNILNKISLNGLSFEYIRYPAGSPNYGQDSLQIIYQNANALDFVFLKITKITLTKDNTGVFLGFEGSFLGIPISSSDPNTKDLAGKGSNVNSMPGVPGAGTQLFDLQYLGLGQHVALYPTAQLNTVEDATTALKRVFQPPLKPQPGKPPILPIPAKPVTPPPKSVLVFDNNSSWLIGAQCTIMETVNLSIIFNDPNLYGLLINLTGSKAGVFENLKFEILYKKVTDTVGVYQIQLQLPDAMRHIEFGEVSITLPIVGVDIYTNGSFKIDFGFPANLDFSRSLTVQVFPFIGSGGFYFAYLKDVPSDVVPKTTVGRFSPIIQFGLGLSLGVGKTIDEGIFSAGLSLTVIGIIEGVIALYNPNLPSYPGKGEYYHWIQGTVGIVGRIYGSVNFAIISARVDITAYAYIRLTIESYNSIPIYFEAGVSVSLSVKINLGLFSIHISLRFSATIRASFVIGTDNRKNAPWNYIPPQQSARAARSISFTENLAMASIVSQILWQPIILTAAEKQTLKLYFMPHLTISGEQGNGQKAQYAGMLYMDAPDPDNPGTTSSYNNFVRAVLLWSINAFINSSQTNITLDNLLKQSVSLEQLTTVYCYLVQNEDSFSSIPYSSTDNNDILHFLSNWFNINIIPVATTQQATIHGTVFPAIPALGINYVHNGTPNTINDFSTYNTCDANYLNAVQTMLAAMAVEYENGVGAENPSICDGITTNSTVSETSLSLATFIFQDYFVMTAKAILQDAIDTFKAYQHPLSVANGLGAIVTYYNQAPLNNTVDAGSIAVSNKSVSLTKGINFYIAGVTYSVVASDTLTAIVTLYNKNLTSGNAITVAQLDTAINNQIVGLLITGTVVKVTGYEPYTVTGNDTLTTIAKNLKPTGGSPAATTLQVITAIQDQEVLSLFAKITLPQFTYVTGATDNFGALADNYSVSIETLAAVNGSATFQGTSITIPGLTNLGVQTISDSTCTADNVTKISGMSSRFLLHGLRLPDPGNMAQLKPLYVLTGQQLALPALAQNDTFSTQLSKDVKCTWITFNGSQTDTTLPVSIDNGEISRITDLVSLTLAPGGTAVPLELYRVSQQTFSLKTNIDWIYPGQIVLPIGKPLQQTVITPTIWQLPDTLLQQLYNNTSSRDLDLEIKIITQDQPDTPFVTTMAQNYGWGTLLNVAIKKVDNDDAPINGNVYDVIGADEAGTLYLERLLTFVNANGDSIVNQIQLLYAPDKTGNSGKAGLQSQADGTYSMALVQANLSTDTNPVTASFASFEVVGDAPPPPNTLNTFQDFISLLWKCSITRSGGYYLYYTVKDGNGGLPDYLFNEDGTANISILVNYGNKASSQNFITHAIIADTIDTSKSSVYIESETLTTTSAIVPPGNAGVLVTRPNAGEYVPINPYPIPANAASQASDMIYLLNQFNLMGYNLIAGTGFNAAPLTLMPVGASESTNQDQLASMPAVPKANTTDDWKYESMLPVFKFASTRIQPSDPNFPPASGDPYSGIGSTAQIQLNWQDMFGNIITSKWPQNSNVITNKILYNDALNGISRWPNVTSGYVFSSTIAPNNLQVFFGFDACRYTHDDKEQLAEIDSVTYSNIYYQLIQLDVQCFLQTSMDNNKAQLPIDKQALINYAGTIFRYLQRIINPNLPAVTINNPVLSFATSAVNPDDIFELTVNLTIQRTANIDPVFKDIPGVASVTTLIGAATTAAPPVVAFPIDCTNRPELPLFSLEQFATSFEATFKNVPTQGIVLKVATGLTQDELNNQSSNNKIWIVRFDTTGKNGINLAISNAVQYFFSPIPLATSLNTYPDVPINSYETGKPFTIDPKTALKKTFSSIDLDAWGSLCLSAIDEFLSPEFAVPGFIIDDGVTLQKILDAKQKLADAITGTMDKIIETEGTDLSNIANAQEVFRQQLLIQLSNAYNIDAVVQNPATMQSPFTGTNIQPVKTPPYNPMFYGQMQGEGPQGSSSDTSNEYSLSTAKIPMGNGPSWLNYVFCAKEAAKTSSYLFTDMTYNITHIEHQIEDVTGITGYRASAWLNFILPLDPSMGELGKVDIPIPLRSYPVPPSVTAQQAIYGPNGQLPDYTTMDIAKSWDFNFTYRQQDAAQDSINVNVKLNINPVASAMFASAQSQLPAALAQFISIYPAVRADFITFLRQVNLTTQQQQPSVFTNAQIAMSAFYTAVKYVADEWIGWNQVNPINLADGFADEEAMAMGAGIIPNIEVNYVINDEEAVNGDPTSDLWAVITPDKANDTTLPLPIIGITGYESKAVDGQTNTWRFLDPQSNTYLSYEDRGKTNTRQLDYTPLNILDWQNAWAGIYITRNRDLVKGSNGEYLPTNPSFIYQTPLVRFFNQLNPLLTCNEGIDVASINSKGTPQAQDLAVHLSNLYAALLSSKAGGSQLIKTECVYTYNLNGQANYNQISLPVVLCPPDDINNSTDLNIGTAPYCPIDNAGFVCNLTRALLFWYASETPNTNNGMLIFKIVLYDAFNNQLPVLKLNAVTLDISYINEWNK